MGVEYPTCRSPPMHRLTLPTRRPTARLQSTPGQTRAAMPISMQQGALPWSPSVIRAAGPSPAEDRALQRTAIGARPAPRPRSAVGTAKGCLAMRVGPVPDAAGGSRTRRLVVGAVTVRSADLRIRHIRTSDNSLQFRGARSGMKNATAHACNCVNLSRCSSGSVWVYSRQAACSAAAARQVRTRRAMEVSTAPRKGADRSEMLHCRPTCSGLGQARAPVCNWAHRASRTATAAAVTATAAVAATPHVPQTTRRAPRTANAAARRATAESAPRSIAPA